MKKPIQFSKLKVLIVLSFLLFLYIFISAYFYSITVSNNLSKNIFRLHIIANSDCDEDQKLKYIIRDNLINYLDTICYNCNTKEDTIKTVSNHLSEFNEIANKTILQNGFHYKATVEIGKYQFPTKTYGDISFPSGYYDGLKVKIGNATRS